MVTFSLALLSVLVSSISSEAPVISVKPSLNVMLMEADLLTPETCEQVQRASMFPTSVKYMGYWFCFESILGRFVDYTTIKNTENAVLVHYPLRLPESCRSGFANVKDVYVFQKLSKPGKVKIIEHTEDEAYDSEFVQKAITAVELMAEMMCNKTTGYNYYYNALPDDDKSK